MQYLSNSYFFKAEQSAELKIAKVAVTNVFLWICIWSPYAMVVIIGPFGDRTLLTPLATQIPSCAAKLASIFNPIMFALSHPKYVPPLCQEMHFRLIGRKKFFTQAEWAPSPPQASKQRTQ